MISNVIISIPQLGKKQLFSLYFEKIPDDVGGVQGSAGLVAHAAARLPARPGVAVVPEQMDFDGSGLLPGSPTLSRCCFDIIIPGNSVFQP